VIHAERSRIRRRRQSPGRREGGCAGRTAALLRADPPDRMHLRLADRIRGAPRLFNGLRSGRCPGFRMLLAVRSRETVSATRGHAGARRDDGRGVDGAGARGCVMSFLLRGSGSLEPVVAAGVTALAIDGALCLACGPALAKTPFIEEV
jgi:hypothetical protein